MDELAKKMGISLSALSQNISGNPSLNKIKDIADKLEVPITRLFDEPEKEDVIVLIFNDTLKKFSPIKELEDFVKTIK